jgi:hypothetical protein
MCMLVPHHSPGRPRLIGRGGAVAYEEELKAAEDAVLKIAQAVDELAKAIESPGSGSAQLQQARNATEAARNLLMHARRVRR